jgi:predicted metalloprotease with PDZ domain
MEQAYSRPSSSSSDQPKLPPEVAHEIEGYRRTVWEVSNNFVLAMAQYPTVAMHLIYSPTGKNQDLDDERFSFFDGLLVGLPNGKVTVLAVEKESKAEQAGIKAGDEIVSVGGASTQNDLAAFAAAYAAAKKIATENEAQSYPMTLRSEGNAETRTVNVPMPPKIKSGLMDGF